MTKSPVIIERHDLFFKESPLPRARAAVASADTAVLTLVGGTGHWEWALPGSPFRTQVLEPAGITVAARYEFWSGDAAGLPKWLNPWAKDPLSDWRIGGQFLAETLSWLPYERRNVLVHSHALSVGLFAAASVPIRNLVSISGPVRMDTEMRPLYENAATNIARLVQIRNKGFDKMQFLGGLFDSHWGSVRDLPPAANTTNIRIPEIGHSDLLYEVGDFHHWRDDGLLPLLTEAL